MKGVLTCLGILTLYFVVGHFLDEKVWQQLETTITRGKEIIGALLALCAAADLGKGGKLFANHTGLGVVSSSCALALVGSSMILEEGAWGPAVGAGLVITGPVLARALTKGSDETTTGA